MRLWKEQRLRIHYTGPGEAALDQTLNRGDVALVEKSRAQRLIDTGQAELTDAEIGSPVPLTPDRECWRCGGGGLGFGDAKCRWCGCPQ